LRFEIQRGSRRARHSLGNFAEWCGAGVVDEVVVSVG
jgi:hypothetical protein